jgi:hypothetical protein
LRANGRFLRVREVTPVNPYPRRVAGRRNEAGYAMVMVALSIFALLGILGLAIDLGYFRYVKRQLQTAADAAALAGAMDLTYGTWSTAGKAASSENGFADTVNGVTVTINNPPQNGPFAGSSYPTYVEAIVKQTTVPTFFSKIFGVNNVTLSASSVAAGGINCIYGLDTLSGGALSLTFSVVNSNCGVVDNANLTGLFGALCAPSIQLVGSNNIVVGGTCTSGFRAAKPVKITTPAPDPLANLPAPAILLPPPTCPPTGNPGPNIVTSGTVSQTPVYCGGTQIKNATGTVTVNPGTYFGSTTGAPAFLIQNSTVTFRPGTYYIVSQTAGTPGLQLSSLTFGGSTTVSFGSGTYNVYGGITDNDLFGSAVNWNSSAGSSALFNIVGGGLHLTGSSGNSGSAGASSGGVTFYNTGTAAAGAVTTYGTITSRFDFQAFCGSNCQLSAPTSGTYAGILFFQDRNNTATTTCGFGGTAGACFDAGISASSGNVSQAGAYYFPNSTVGFNFDFGSGAPYSLLVAKDISWFVTFTINNNYASLPNGSPLRQGSAVLVQ